MAHWQSLGPGRSEPSALAEHRSWTQRAQCIGRASVLGAASTQACIGRAPVLGAASTQACIGRASVLGAASTQACIDRASVLGAASPQACIDRASVLGAASTQACIDRASVLGAASPQVCLYHSHLSRANKIAYLCQMQSLTNYNDVVMGPWPWTILLLLKEVGSARLRDSDIHPISPKTPAPKYQPILYCVD